VLVCLDEALWIVCIGATESVTMVISRGVSYVGSARTIYIYIYIYIYGIYIRYIYTVYIYGIYIYTVYIYGIYIYIYIRCIYGIFGREIARYTVNTVCIYGSGQP